MKQHSTRTIVSVAGRAGRLDRGRLLGRGRRVRSSLVSLGVGCALAGLVCSGVAIARVAGDPPTNAGDRMSCAPACASELARARTATDKYHDSSRALRDGFVAAGGCEQSAEGGMGVHYVNLARYAAHRLDPSLDAARPEFLLYRPGDNGGRQRLAGVEYGVPVFLNGLPYYGSAPPDPRVINPAPTFFGHTFDGPMRGHVPEQPWHYDLHVWLWSKNPAGVFAPWNPAWRCPAT